MYLSFRSLAVPFALAALATMALFITRALFFRFLHKRQDKIGMRVDDLVIGTVKTPSIFWCLAIGLYIGLSLSDLPERYVLYLNKGIHIILIFSITVAASNLIVRIFRAYVQKADIPLPSTGLVYGVLKGTVMVAGILIILSILGVSIAPLITAFGVGGLAVALALKDTLENLFAGIHILVEKSVRVGDFVRLETGQEGYVEDITWRTTRIRMLGNNMVVIPNNKLSQSIVINYYLPTKSMSLHIAVPVSYEADARKVEKILTEEAQRAFTEVPGLVKGQEPSIRFMPGFGENSLGFTLACQVEDVTDQYTVQHELRMRIWERFRGEGIEMPSGMRLVGPRRDA